MKALAVALAALLSSASSLAVPPKRIVDLGEGEIYGDLKRPQLRWVDSSAAMRAILPKIHARKFAELEAQLLRPLTREEWRRRLNAISGSTR